MDKKVLVIDVERESVDFNKTKEVSLKESFKEYEFTKDFKNVDLNYDFYISKDHSVSYDLLREANKKFENIALIIFDQHMDIWSESLTGTKLNKANFIIKAFNDNLIKFVVFVGTRKSELAAFKKVLFLNKFDKKFTKDLIKENKFEDFNGKIKIIKTTNFVKGFNKAVKFLNKKNFKNICLDIDLDVFDTDIIKGVEYNKKNLKNVFKEFDDNLGKYILHIFLQKGISPNINFKRLKRNINLIYKHITEYAPRFDDGKTLKLVKEIINGI